MRVLTAKVVDRRLDMPEDSFEEGNTVATLLVPNTDEGFSVSPEEQSLLLKAIDQAVRGEVVDGWDLLDQLKD